MRPTPALLLALVAAAVAILLTGPTPAAAASPAVLFDRDGLLAYRDGDGEANHVRQRVASGRLSAGQSTPARVYFNPTVVCVTGGCVQAVAKDGGGDLGTTCAAGDGTPACKNFGGRGSKAFRLVAAKGGSARYLEFSTFWPGNQVYKDA